MEKTSAGVNGGYLCIPVNPPPFSAGSPTSITNEDKPHRQTPGGVSLRGSVASSEMQHPRSVGHLKCPAGNGNTDADLWANVNEGVLAANIILAQSMLSISRILIGIAAVFFYCLDVYVRATRPGDDPRTYLHWDMVAFGLCIAGILLCLVDWILTCRAPKWRFAAVGMTSSTNQPICVVVVNHQGSVYVDHVTCDTAHSENGDCAKTYLL